MPDDSYTQVTIVAAATAVAVVPARPGRKTLAIQNAGANDAYMGSTSTVNASTGWVLAAGGGGYTWAPNEVPREPVYVFSTAGTDIRVKEGL